MNARAPGCVAGRPTVSATAKGRAWPVPGAIAALCAALANGCTDRAAERAERDLEVGLGEAGGVAFEVREGLGSIRALAPGQLVLWATAPVIDVSAEAAAGATRTWTIEVRNCLPDAELAIAASTGAGAAATWVAATVPTRRTYQVDLPDGARTTLHLAPPGGDLARPFRFAALGDVQNGVDTVGELFARIAQEPGVELVLGMGDSTQEGTAEQMERFQLELEALPVPYFSVIGNHDAPEDTPWHDLFGRASERFGYRGVQFSLVDSAGAMVTSQVYQWLDTWLDDARARVHIVTMHMPPLDPVGGRNGSFASRAEAGEMLSKLAGGQVDLTLYGHVHSYYSFENAGIPAFITGGGGAFEERLDGIGRHYLVFEVDPARGVLSSRFVGVD